MTQEIENRFQILITISLFFPLLFYNLGIAAGRGAGEAIQVSLEFGVLVGAVIVAYIAFQLRKNNLKERSLRRISGWLLVGIGMFVVPIVGTALSADPALPAWLEILVTHTWTPAIFFVLLFPIIVELVILFGISESS